MNDKDKTQTRIEEIIRPVDETLKMWDDLDDTDFSRELNKGELTQPLAWDFDKQGELEEFLEHLKNTPCEIPEETDIIRACRKARREVSAMTDEQRRELVNRAMKITKQGLSTQLYHVYMAAYNFTINNVTAKQVEAYNDFVTKLDQIGELDLYDFDLVDGYNKRNVETGIEEEVYFEYIARGHTLIDNAYREYIANNTPTDTTNPENTQ